jgi:hypothetical protein
VFELIFIYILFTRGIWVAIKFYLFLYLIAIVGAMIFFLCISGVISTWQMPVLGICIAIFLGKAFHQQRPNKISDMAIIAEAENKAAAQEAMPDTQVLLDRLAAYKGRGFVNQEEAARNNRAYQEYQKSRRGLT